MCLVLSVLIFHHKIISRVQYIALEVITFLKGKYFFRPTDIKLTHNDSSSFLEPKSCPKNAIYQNSESQNHWLLWNLIYRYCCNNWYLLQVLRTWGDHNVYSYPLIKFEDRLESYSYNYQVWKAYQTHQCNDQLAFFIWFVSFICTSSNNFSTYNFSAHPRMPSAAPFFWPLFAIGSLIPMIFIQALPPPMEECILLPCNPHFSQGNCLPMASFWKASRF